MVLEILELHEAVNRTGYDTDVAGLLNSRKLDGYLNHGTVFIRNPVHVGVFDDKELVSCIVYGVSSFNHTTIAFDARKIEYTEPHLYLDYMATREGHERKGYAKELTQIAMRDGSICGDVTEVHGQCLFESEKFAEKIGLNVIECPPFGEFADFIKQDVIELPAMPLVDDFGKKIAMCPPRRFERHPGESERLIKYMTAYHIKHKLPDWAGYFIKEGDLEARFEYWKEKLIKKS
ncbi:MAG: hypothetical protein GOV02_02040 [Candidatus Aenigmarchaeota archaeon]|nr:hypothetical protein [Candidatus Aenigmarchaeota archaeon]